MPGTPRLLPPSDNSLPTNSAVNSHSIRTSLFRATVGVLMASCSASAVNAANCGAAALGGGAAGPPSISATESSTTQVLEEIRRRTQLAQQQAQPIPASFTTTAPAQSEAAASGGSSAAKAPSQPAASAPQKKVTLTKVASAEATSESYESQDQFNSDRRITSSWGQAYLDYEFHDNIAPGTQENRARNSRTAGALSGTDWTWIKAGSVPQAVQFGIFSGYQGQWNTFSNTNFDAPQTTNDSGLDNFNRTNNHQDITGEFYGAYLAAIYGRSTFDLAFKADDFDLNQKSLLTQTNGTCGPGTVPTAFEVGGASVNNYTISGEASYRHPVSPSSWLEPTMGLRFTWTDYGNDPTHLVATGASGTLPILPQEVSGRLGLEDGTVLRLTAGVRAGHEVPLPDGGLWTLIGGAYLYSDVAISGFRYNPPVVPNEGTVSPGVAGTSVFPVDEGKVRGLGQIVSTWDYANGWTYLLAGEVRGGEDVFGVGGRAGARYKW
ncbi:hypothetical protein [Hyphomicrobium sp. 2TAF46]|uniref:hypothetical protein n=1 Tax=Hyphomicrobium sp. 2TAF46 TaxID=3233019 RepID=UPI003F920681